MSHAQPPQHLQQRVPLAGDRQLRRRTFVRTAAAAGAGTLVAPRLVYAQERADDPELNAALVVRERVHELVQTSRREG